MNITDQFQTPPNVCRYMASLIPDGTTTVLEPTPGRGNLVAELDEYEVTAPADYFLMDKNLRFDCVIMNPPFSTRSAILTNAPSSWKNSKGMKFGYKMLLDCTNKSDVIIALMPAFVLSDSDVRLRHLKKFGMISVTSLPRVTFGYARIQTVVLFLHRNYIGPTEFVVFDLLPAIPHKNELILEL